MMTMTRAGRDLLADARATILESLEERGPMTPAELPRRWPVTRVVIRALVEELEDQGSLVRVSRPSGGVALLRITPQGRARLGGRSEAAD